MGVSGAGKTSVGLELASKLGIKFIDGDSFHSEINISKMKNGSPLSDEDREPWLIKIHSELVKDSPLHESTVLACSALKESYRKLLLKDVTNYLIVYLRADITLLKKRLSERKNHFFNPALLASQIATLEVPSENYIEMDSNCSICFIVEEIIQKIGAIHYTKTKCPPSS